MAFGVYGFSVADATSTSATHHELAEDGYEAADAVQRQKRQENGTCKAEAVWTSRGTKHPAGDKGNDPSADHGEELVSLPRRLLCNEPLLVPGEIPATEKPFPHELTACPRCPEP